MTSYQLLITAFIPDFSKQIRIRGGKRRRVPLVDNNCGVCGKAIPNKTYRYKNIKRHAGKKYHQQCWDFRQRLQATKYKGRLMQDTLGADFAEPLENVSKCECGCGANIFNKPDAKRLQRYKRYHSPRKNKPIIFKRILQR